MKDDSEKDVAEINELYIEGNLLLDFFLDEADSFFLRLRRFDVPSEESSKSMLVNCS